MPSWSTGKSAGSAAGPRGDAPTPRLVGYVGLSVPTFMPEILPAVEVGWRFAPWAWGHGYATEGAAAALDEAFTTMGLQQVCSLPQTDNPRSCLVAERLGMRRVEERVVAANNRRDAVPVAVYEIDAGEWLARRRPA